MKNAREKAHKLRLFNVDMPYTLQNFVPKCRRDLSFRLWPTKNEKTIKVDVATFSKFFIEPNDSPLGSFPSRAAGLIRVKTSGNASNEIVSE